MNTLGTQFGLRLGPVILGTLLCCAMAFAEDVDEIGAGRAIFLEQCADCHGADGQGVAGAYESPLEGDLSIKQLIAYVAETMPEGHPEACVGDDARLVTQFFMNAFYTREARLRNNPPKIEFSRLTIDQYHNAVTDVMRPIMGEGWLSDRRGLTGRYSPNGRQFTRAVAFSRIDPRIDFDFADAIPEYHPAYEDSEEFGMEWTGGLIAPSTGTYDIFVRSENGFRVFLNRAPWDQEALIDNWVDANEGEYRASIKLRAGRVYPLTIQYQKYKEPTANISLEWKPPHGVRQVIPQSNLSPDSFPYLVNLQTEFPPDDSTTGYERGTSVSTEWDRATTRGAMEVLDFVRRNRDAIERLGHSGQKYKGQPTNTRRSKRRRSGKMSPDDKLKHLQGLSETFVRTAFRRPLEDREQQLFVERAFEGSQSPESAFERVVLMTLKSPQFLYLPGFDQQPTAFDVATRMSMLLYDSLPDLSLLEAAESGALLDEDRIKQQAWRLVHQQGTRVKIQKFFNQWLETERAAEGTKDEEAFPGFDDQLVASLRKSLEMLVEDVVWSDESDFRVLLTSDTIFMDRRMADFYALDWDEVVQRDSQVDSNSDDNGHFVAITFEPEQRAGLLTHPFLMAGFSYHRNTSPIHRGVFVAKRIIGRTLKSPPVEVEPLEEDFDPTMTTRERVAHQTKGTMCQSCHSIINPLGFSFEHFDAVGKYRETEKSKRIDSASSYMTPDGQMHSWNSATELSEFLVSSEDVHRNFIEQLFQFMARQPLAAYGTKQSDQLLEKFQGSGFNVKNLIVEMAIIVATHKMEHVP